MKRKPRNISREFALIFILGISLGIGMLFDIATGNAVDPNPCNSMSTAFQKDSCYLISAIETDDDWLCAQISAPDLRSMCMNEVGGTKN